MAYDDQAGQLFNAGLDTAHFVANLRKEIHYELDAGDFKAVRGKLWALNNELIGWFVRKDNKDNKIKREELEKYEKMAFRLNFNSSEGSESIESLLRIWSRVAITYAHEVWLSKERDADRSVLA